MTPGLKTLFIFADLFIPNEVEKYKKSFTDGTLKFVELKDALAEAIYRELKPFQEKRKQIASDLAYVEKVIKNGAQKAKSVAYETLKEVKEKMGLL
jgi:Tryptophanyl-tRNA synthetase